MSDRTLRLIVALCAAMVVGAAIGTMLRHMTEECINGEVHFKRSGWMQSTGEKCIPAK